MPHLIIEGTTSDGSIPFRYEVVGTLQEALATLDNHVQINGNRQLQTTTINDGTVTKVRGFFRTPSNERVDITIFEHVPSNDPVEPTPVNPEPVGPF